MPVEMVSYVYSLKDFAMHCIGADGWKKLIIPELYLIKACKACYSAIENLPKIFAYYIPTSRLVL
jgi:hypothetical protein